MDFSQLLFHGDLEINTAQQRGNHKVSLDLRPLATKLRCKCNTT